MSAIVQITAEERAHGVLTPATATAAASAMTAHGFVILRGLLDVAVVDAMHGEFTAQYGNHDVPAMQALSEKSSPVVCVGNSRFEITLRMTGAFGPGVFANPLLLRFLTPILGELRLSGFTAVASYPGSDMQRMHRDHAHLFPDYGVGPMLPAYAINVSVPLIDVDETTGPTGIWPGSHRMVDGKLPPKESMLTIPFQRGDAILIDYRTAHAGLPNRSNRVRPIVYMVYARPWFFDDINHPQRSPLDMPLEAFYGLSDDTKQLLMRAYSQQMRAQLLTGQAV